MDKLKGLVDAFGESFPEEPIKRKSDSKNQISRGTNKSSEAGTKDIETTTQIQSKPSFKEFEPVTARLDYDDLLTLRTLKDNVKHERRLRTKRVGEIRERITDNSFIRAILGNFLNHPDLEDINFGDIDTEEDVYREVSKLFKKPRRSKRDH